MLQTFVPNASDGWRLATASVRDLYAEGDLHADEVGGDFAADSERLGAATASVHADMAAVLPTEPADRDWYATVAAQMTERLEAATEVVPQLAEHADGPARAVRRRGRQPTEPRRPPAGARRPAPRPGPADGDRLDRARLRGRARPAAGRPPRARQPAARRRRDAAQLRLRRPAHAGRAARRPAARLPRPGVGGPQPQRVLRRLLRTPAASTRAGNHHSFGRSRPTRRFTSASTRHATVRTG